MLAMVVLSRPCDSVFKEHPALVQRADDFLRRDEPDRAQQAAQAVAPVDGRASHTLVADDESLVRYALESRLSSFRTTRSYFSAG